MEMETVMMEGVVERLIGQDEANRRRLGPLVALASILK